MTSIDHSDALLTRLRRSLSFYGERLSRVVLFGSRARGDASADSDYDVAVFLHSMDDRWAELIGWPGCASTSSTRQGPFWTRNPIPPLLTQNGRR